MHFRGTFPEIEGISADNFGGENLNSSVYFLSHIHSDHLPGFYKKEFEEKLKQPNIYLYSSRISTSFLCDQMPDYKDKFIYLEINQEKMIEIPGQDSTLVVKTIPAEHCPGSVMFLFRYKGKTIVYTGDFRYELNDLEKYRRYFCKEKIDKVYLDVTFFRKEFPSFPNRELVMEKLCEVILEWLEANKENSVIICTPAYYGSEFLYKGIYDKLKIPVNVSPRIYDIIKRISELKAGVTLQESKIRSDYKRNVGPQPKNVKCIFPSAFYWTNWDGETILEDYVEETKFCYSCHASYEEVYAFLKMIKPKEIEANVVPSEEEERVILEELIEECLMDISSESSEENEDVEDGDIIVKKRRYF